MSIYFWRSGRRSRQVTPLINIPKVWQLSKMIDGMTSLINIPKIMQLSKMIDGITSLINIPNILLLQNRPINITYVQRRIGRTSRCMNHAPVFIRS